MAMKFNFGKKKETEEVVYHFIFLEDVPMATVASAVMAWQESAWWPKKCSIHFLQKSAGAQPAPAPKQPLFKQAPSAWVVEVTKFVPGRLQERTVKTGLWEGVEILRIEERANGSRVVYELHCQIKGFLKRILWNFSYRKQLEKDIKLIFSALKEFIIKQHKAKQEGDSV